VWRRTVNGRELHFHLAGINNQNFLMRDEETNSWWQQITGKAIYGPLQGAVLDPVLCDELTFGEWKSEVSGGQVLAPVAKYIKEYDSDWEPKVAKLPVVISFPGTALKPRDVIVGLAIGGAARAYPWETALEQSPIVDRVHETPLLLAVGPDKKSFRVFVSRVDGKDTEFYLKGDTKDWVLIDTRTASEWNFQGCATRGVAVGKCLDQVYALKDFWFDWRNYHPQTTVYRH
jgi:Protein of unknown function (DUF3179)